DYSADDDLTNLHYIQGNQLPRLDSAEGGDALMDLCAEYQPQFVVIDTLGRVIEGAENDSDTFRSYFRHSGARLKAAGITSLRLDHAGKKPKQGQRGSSPKAEDVDIVWNLTATGSNLTLKATHRRLSWVPEKVRLKRVDGPPIRHDVDHSNDTSPPG